MSPGTCLAWAAMSVDLVVVALAAFGCGVVNSMAGGGSLLLFPALTATGMGALAANVTNSVITLPGYVGGVVGFRGEVLEERRSIPPLVAATVAGSTLGCSLLLATSEASFDIVVPVLLGVASVLIALQPRVVASVGAGVVGRSRWAAPAGVLGATVYGGYFGAGLGVLLLAVLGVTIDAPFHRLNAIKAALSVADATVSLVVFGLFGPVEWWAVAVGAPATLVGGYVGARVSGLVSEAVLRRVVVVFGATAAVVFALT